MGRESGIEAAAQLPKKAGTMMLRSPPRPKSSQHYCRAGSKVDRPTGSDETPPRDLGGVFAFWPTFRRVRQHDGPRGGSLPRSVSITSSDPLGPHGRESGPKSLRVSRRRVPGLRGVGAREGGIDAVANAIRWLSRHAARDFCIKACGDAAAIVAANLSDPELTVISNTRPESMTPAERDAEVASIFARGLARAIHAERSRSTRESSDQAKSDADRLELPRHADLSVSARPRG